MQVLTVRDILKYGVSDHMGARVDLEELAMKALEYNMAEGFTVADLNEQVPPVYTSLSANLATQTGPLLASLPPLAFPSDQQCSEVLSWSKPWELG